MEVNTNEENEKELLKIRAKLYRFDSSNEQSEWKVSFNLYTHLSNNYSFYLFLVLSKLCTTFTNNPQQF